MRNVMQQSSLAIHQRPQLACHAVKIVSEIGQFVTPSPHAAADLGLEIACGNRLESTTQLADRLSDIPGQTGGTEQAGEKAGNQYRHRG